MGLLKWWLHPKPKSQVSGWLIVSGMGALHLNVCESVDFLSPSSASTLLELQICDRGSNGEWGKNSAGSWVMGEALWKTKFVFCVRDKVLH